ncbi:hypothetical protein GQ44DRAFT_769483 [Phaeosphaeriaceae sp. PMI808]|nr:hypothetical protein GQ44DRAFT_769483 [Phaeosphaeriaceae sp. PMI808]
MTSTRASVNSHTSTMQSMRNQVGYKVRSMAQHGQPTIEINLNGSDGTHNSWVTSYSTMDTIEGNVTVVASHDTRFEDIDIAFIGTSQTYVDTLSTTPSLTGRTAANHRFLVLRQPIAESDFPSPRILEAGRRYQFPFTFTVPTQLLPKSCSHRISSDHVRDCHLMLPPSLGDPDLAGFGSTLLDDLAPEMSKIMYTIKVRIAHIRGTEGIAMLGEKTKKVRIKPALIEQPPLNIDGNKEYRPCEEKTVRKGLFKGKLGTLSAKTIQPKPLVIPGARTSGNQPITTMAKLLLRFDPSDESTSPPKLTSLATKLKVTTYFASSPRQSFPSRLTLGFDVSQGAYAESIPLSTLCIAAAQWEKHPPSHNPPPEASIPRRDSGISDCSLATTTTTAHPDILPPTKTYQNGTFYTTQILVPIALPTTKNFIPTFHSCLISRTYTLGLKFAAQASPSLNLKIPVQICADGSDTGIENARARSVEEEGIREAAGMWDVAPPGFEEVGAEEETGRRGSSVVGLSGFEEIGGGGGGGAGRSASVGAREEFPPDYLAFAAPTRRYRGSVGA